MKHKKQISRSKFGRVVEEEFKRKRLVNNNHFMQKYELCGVFLDKNWHQEQSWFRTNNRLQQFKVTGGGYRTEWGVYRDGFAYVHHWDEESGHTYWRYKVKPIKTFVVECSYGQEE